MGRDELDELFEAARPLAPTDPERARRTRRRVLDAARKPRPRALLRRTSWLAPLAAALLASTAWAAATGRLVRHHEPTHAARPLPPSVSAIGRVAADATHASVQAPVPLAPAEPAPAAPAPAPSRPAPASTPSPRTDPDLVAYRHAHDVHFGGGDPARTIAAWDAYLAHFPSGRFAPEARYNRALALVHAGRHAEADVALSAFADAPPGGYRREEARAVRRALRARAR